MTIDELEQLYAEDEARRQELRSEAKEQRQQAKALRKQAERAAASGDFGGSITMSKEQRSLLAAADAAEEAAESLPDGYSPEDVKAFWRLYVSQYEETFEERTQELQAAREALCEAFDNLIDEQQAALEIRERVGILLRRELPPAEGDPERVLWDLELPLYEPKKMELISSMVVPADDTLDFVLAHREKSMNDSDVQRYNRIIRRHRSGSF